MAFSPYSWRGNRIEDKKDAGILRWSSYSAKYLFLTPGPYPFRGLSCSLIVMVQPTQHGNSANLVLLVWWRRRKRQRVRNALAKSLIGSSLVEVHDIRASEAGRVASPGRSRSDPGILVLHFP